MQCQKLPTRRSTQRHQHACQLASGTPGCKHASRPARPARPPSVQARAAPEAIATFNGQQSAKRMSGLGEQAMDALQFAVNEYEHPVFPCALIAGDVVILHLLHKAGLLSKVEVVFIDTLHLFPETIDFMRACEQRYGFSARWYTPKDFATQEAYEEVHGVDLPIRDIQAYDRICKVEPFQRALAETQCDVMINGRRRDHGAERAHLDLFDAGATGPSNCQPLAYWEFRDCFAFADADDCELHPLHAAGYPSVGDVHSTLPVERSKWFEYGAERSGRFQGLTNADGSDKTECGIHTVSGSPPASELAGATSSLKPPGSSSKAKP